ncbi:nucleocapsid protein N [Pacui virus]|uniref:Nucleoprotein n=1 Tax=Pacui virus TaxID=1538454 RepID=A0A088NBT2_9VIRU|nr:nucleocapsid protein N [Pacui virus]AIN55743.1 nucleocapsid protein N [Pacui virus]
MDNFIFETDDVINSNTFNPEELYAMFRRDLIPLSSDGIKVAAIFFKRMKVIKDRMKSCQTLMIPLKLFDMEFTVVNTYGAIVERLDVKDSDFTLNRLSGCLARYVYEVYMESDQTQKALIKESIKNPLAIVKGVRPDDFKLYMAFSAGTEMFLDTFGLLPLAITLRRVETDDAPSSVLNKVLKQRLGGMQAIEWQKPGNVKLLKEAMIAVNAVSWRHSKVTDEAIDFLKKAGIAISTITKIRKGAE